MKSEFRPYKVIHHYKNDYKRTQYLMYIYIGSLLTEDTMKVLNKIQKLDIIDSLEKITKKDVKLMEEEFCEDWYNYFFLSAHIHKKFTNISKSKIKEFSSKFGESWVNKHIVKYKLTKKDLIFSHQTLFEQNLKSKQKSVVISRKKEMDFRTYIQQNEENKEKNKQVGGNGDAGVEDIDVEDISVEETEPKDEDLTDMSDIEDIEDISAIDNEISEPTEKESDLEKIVSTDESDDIDKKSSKTADLIAAALNEKSWKKEKSDKSDFNSKIDKNTFDMELSDVYEKIYIENRIYNDDNIKTVQNKITYTIPLNENISENNHILPSRQYLYSKYMFKNKEEKIMIGQKWSRRNELLNIDVIPNNNLQTYENLRGNLKYLRDKFNIKIKRIDESDLILSDYSNFMLNNEIFMIDIYSQLGMNIKPNPEQKRNLFDVFVSLYFPNVNEKQLDEIIKLLNKQENNEDILINEKFKTIRNDLKLETEISELIDDTIKNKSEEINKYILDNNIIQAIINVNIYDKKNITGTSSDEKFNLYLIFDNFIVNKEYPFIHYNALDSGITYKFYDKSVVLKDSNTMKKWFNSIQYGITIKKRVRDDKYISINITEMGKIEYRVSWLETENALMKDVEDTYDIIRDILKKINSENKQVRFINPENERFEYAFVNSIQKLVIPDKYKIDHNDLSDFCRYFYPYISVVIQPRKKLSKLDLDSTISKYGTYLRYKKVTGYDNKVKMHMRILYIMRNFEFTDKELLDEVSKHYNMTYEETGKEIDFVREKYASSLRKMSRNLKPLSSLPKSKPPGIGIDIQGRDTENYKIRLTGVRSKQQLLEVSQFLRALMYLYTETYLFKKSKFQKIKETLKKLTNIAKRRGKVREIVDYERESTDIKMITKLDKKRLGFRPEEGQSQWTRACQNSGEDKKRRPEIVSSDNIKELIRKGFKLDKKSGMYIKTHKDKDLKKEITMRAIPLEAEEGKTNYYYCDPEVNKQHKYIGFLIKGNNPDDLCMPCCFKKDQYVSDNKVKENYFKKCIGEVKDYVVEKKSLDTVKDKIYVLQHTKKVQEGRFLFLTKYLDFFFNKLWDNDKKIKNHFLVESNSGYYLKFMVKDMKHHFIAAISAIYGLSFDEIIEKIVKFFGEKKNKKYFYYLNNGDIFMRFETLENYLLFLESKKLLDYSIVGEVLSLPGVLEEEGLGIYIFNEQLNKIDDKENKKEKISYNLDCLDPTNKKYLLNKKKNVVLVKENKYYFPIFMAIKKKGDKRVELKKTFEFEDKNGNIVNQLRALYISGCSENILEQISIASKYNAKNMMEILEKLKPETQYLDVSGKVKYIKLKEILLPVYPSGIDYNYDYTFSNPKFETIENIMKKIKNVEKIDKLFSISKVLYDKKKKDSYRVHSVLLKNQLVLPIKETNLSMKEINRMKLKIELRPDEDSLNKMILKEEKISDDVKLNVNKNLYLEEGYNLFRFELSNYLNEENLKVKREIIEINDSEISDKKKRDELKKYLISISNPKLKKYLKNGNVKKYVYFVSSLGKKKDMNNFKINNQRNICGLNKNANTCNNLPYCEYVNKKCMFSMEDEIVIEYVNRVIEDFILKNVSYKEIIQEDNYFVSDIVDINDFTNRDNQKIIRNDNLSLNKIMNELFGNESAPQIGKKKKDFYEYDEQVEMEEIGDNYSQEIISNSDSNIRAYVNGFYWLKNPLYYKERRNLGYKSVVQDNLTNLLKAKIIKKIQDMESIDSKDSKINIPKELIKYFENKNEIESKLMDFAKSRLNTKGTLEFYVLSLIYDIPILLFNKYNEIIEVYDNGKIIKDKNKTKYSYKNSIKIKHDVSEDIKTPKKIYVLY